MESKPKKFIVGDNYEVTGNESKLIISEIFKKYH